MAETTILLAAPEATPPESCMGVIGQKVGRFEILAELGRGGMGVVYRCHDPLLRREVAIKMIRDSAQAEASDLVRFRREGSALAKLRHPGMVTVHEVGQHGGRPYLVMDFVEGENLEDFLRREEPTVHRSVEIVLEVAQSLNHAHGAGIIHRDVKPQNIMIDTQGRSLVMDLGLARVYSASQQLTETGQIMGTPSYMAPEQVDPVVGDHEPATDVYALGAVLYRAVSGHPVFQGNNTLALLSKVLDADPDSLRSLDPTVDRDLDTIVLKCLEKDPRQRYASAAALAEDLQRYLDGREILARPISQRERASRWGGRNRTLSAAGLLNVMAIGAIALLVTQESPSSDGSLDAKTEPVAPQSRPGRLVGKSEPLSLGERATIPSKTQETTKPTQWRQLVYRLQRAKALKMHLYHPPEQATSKSNLIEIIGPLEDLSDEDLGLLNNDRLPNLWVLDLTNSKVTDAGLEHLKRPKNQERIVTLTEVTDAGLESTENLTGLQKLLLGNTKVSDSGLMSLRELETLTNLALQSTAITDEGLIHLENLKSLVNLNLEDTHITDAGLKHIRELSALTDLRLAGTQITDAGLEQFKGLLHLKLLDLHNTQVTGPGLKHIKKLRRLQVLLLYDTPVNDTGLEHLREMVRLEKLYLEDTQITDAGLFHLKGLTNLEYLNLSHTRVTDAGLIHLKGLTELEELTLAGTQVTDAGLEHLEGLTNLEKLNLSSNPNFGHAGLTHLGRMTQLKDLYLTTTQVTDADLDHLKDLTELRLLEVYNTGSVTAEGVERLRRALPKCEISR